jgi:SAM-dependent methyltransferase
MDGARRAADAARRAAGVVRARLGRDRTEYVPVGQVRFGTLRRLTPLSRQYGFDRGQPVDRYFIEDFLRRHGTAAGYASGVIRGRVLEIGDDLYTRRFGYTADGATGITAGEVLNPTRESPKVTIVGDLLTGAGLEDDAFDCIICTQTLNVIFDTRAALHTLHRALKPGGTLLLTVPGITGSIVPDRDTWGDWWRFTTASMRRLLEAEFDADRVYVEAYGNVLTAAGFLYGLAAEDLRAAELDSRDRDFEVVVTARAIKR